MLTEIAFQIAGVEVLLRGEPSMMVGLPPVAFARPVRAPGLVVELEHHAALDDAALAPDHPRFARRLDRDVLVVERGDARGRIDASAAPVRARFEVGANLHAREACLRVALSVALPCHQALILHASAVRWAGKAHVFTGVSGAGKSTIAALLDGHPGCARLADELLILARGDDGWRVHVPPVLGKVDLPVNDAAPLASVDLLVQAAAHHRERLGGGAALRELLRHVVVYAAEPATTERVLGLVERLVHEVPCHRLAFTPDLGVAAVLGVT
jgi:hypothetical protein